MSFEAGKTYKTRDGRDVIIYRTDARSMYPIHGCYMEDGEEFPMSWMPNGSENPIAKHPLDIMPPRPEPISVKMWANVYDDGMRVYRSEATARGSTTAIRKAVPVMVTEITEGE